VGNVSLRGAEPRVFDGCCFHRLRLNASGVRGVLGSEFLAPCWAAHINDEAVRIDNNVSRIDTNQPPTIA